MGLSIEEVRALMSEDQKRWADSMIGKQTTISSSLGGSFVCTIVSWSPNTNRNNGVWLFSGNSHKTFRVYPARLKKSHIKESGQDG